MFLLEGATQDPRVTAAALSIQSDISAVTAADIQRLAAQSLKPERQWSLAVLPKGMTLAEASALGTASASAVGVRSGSETQARGFGQAGHEVEFLDTGPALPLPA